MNNLNIFLKLFCCGKIQRPSFSFKPYEAKVTWTYNAIIFIIDKHDYIFAIKYMPVPQQIIS